MNERIFLALSLEEAAAVKTACLELLQDNSEYLQNPPDAEWNPEGHREWVEGQIRTLTAVLRKLDNA